MELKWREQLLVVLMLFGKCNKNSWRDKSLLEAHGLCISLLLFLPVLMLHGCCPKDKVLYYFWLKRFCKVYHACVSQEVYLYICILPHPLCIFQTIILWEFQNQVYWERNHSYASLGTLKVMEENAMTDASSYNISAVKSVLWPIYVFSGKIIYLIIQVQILYCLVISTAVDNSVLRFFH